MQVGQKDVGRLAPAVVEETTAPVETGTKLAPKTAELPAADLPATVDWSKLEIGAPHLRVRARVETLLGRANVPDDLQARAFDRLGKVTGREREAELKRLLAAVETKSPAATFDAYIRLADAAARRPSTFTPDVRTTLVRAVETGLLNADDLPSVVQDLNRVEPLAAKRFQPLIEQAGTKDGRKVMKTADVVAQRLQLLLELGSGRDFTSISKVADQLRPMTSGEAMAYGESQGLLRAFRLADISNYEDSLPKSSPLEFVSEALAERKVPNRRALIDTFGDLPSVKRTLRRLAELQDTGAVKDVAWGAYNPHASSRWEAAARRMVIYKEDPLEMISTIAHETTHIPQNHFVYEPGMTRQAFIDTNKKMLINGEVQAYRVGAEMWGEFMDLGIARKDVPKSQREILDILRAPNTSAVQKRRKLEQHILVELEYGARYEVALGNEFDRTVGAGKPELLETSIAMQAPPDGSRRAPGTSGGRSSAPINEAFVAAATASHGLNSEEAARIGRFEADLRRVFEMITEDPAAALAELMEATRAGPWKGLKIDAGATSHIGEMTVSALYREMKAYDRPDDMSMAQLAYLFGVDEGEYRAQQSTYSATPDVVSFPQNIAVREPPDDMPLELFKPFVKGLREQHVQALVTAFGEAASGRVRQGARIPVFEPAPS